MTSKEWSAVRLERPRPHRLKSSAISMICLTRISTITSISKKNRVWTYPIKSFLRRHAVAGGAKKVIAPSVESATMQWVIAANRAQERSMKSRISLKNTTVKRCMLLTASLTWNTSAIFSLDLLRAIWILNCSTKSKQIWRRISFGCLKMREWIPFSRGSKVLAVQSFRWWEKAWKPCKIFSC